MNNTSLLMIVLFPEDACAKADRIVGEQKAKLIRRQLGDAIHGWHGSIWIINGPNIHDLEDSGMLGVYVDGAINRTKKKPFHASFIHGMKSFANKIEDIIYQLKPSLRAFRLAKAPPIHLVGMGYSTTENGPLNRLKDALEQFGYNVKLGPVFTNPYDEDVEDRELVYEDIVTPKPYMVLVHPGSACGSANFNIGKSDAAGYRDAITHDLNKHDGPLIVVDGDLSDELPSYGSFNQAIEKALQNEGSARIFACDDVTENWSVLVSAHIKKLNLPMDTRFHITGAWYFDDDSSGCVNTVYDAIASLGFSRVDVLDSAVRDPDGELDYDPEGDEED